MLQSNIQTDADQCLLWSLYHWTTFLLLELGDVDDKDERNTPQNLTGVWKQGRLITNQSQTRGVMVSMSAFLACHQCYCTGSSLTWDLNLQAVVGGIFWSLLPGFSPGTPVSSPPSWFFFFFFLHSPAISLGFTTFGWDFCVCDRFFNPTIKIVPFRLCGWYVLGAFLLLAFTRLGHEHQDLLSPCDEMHVCTD